MTSRMRIADAFLGSEGLPAVTDHDFVLGCSCGLRQRLDEMTIDVVGPITVYDCARCMKTLAGVLVDDPRDELRAVEPMTRRQEAGGHRVGGYVVGARVDIALRPQGAERDLLLIPAAPGFFVQYRCV